MNIQTLQEFVILSRHLKLQKAADELYVSAPTLSQHIAALEKELGVLLFNRKGGLSLTYEGGLALEIVQRILSDYEKLTEIVTRRESGIRIRTPRYAVGLDEFLAARTLFQEKHPGCLVSIETNELQMSNPISILREEKSDTALMYITNGSGASIEDYIPEEGDISYFPLKRFAWELVSELSHPLASKETLSMEDLEGATIVVSNCPLSVINMETVKQFFALNGVSVDYLTRQVNRHDDVFIEGLGSYLAFWNKSSVYDSIPLHRFQQDFAFASQAYVLYRPENLSPLQLEYLNEVRRVCSEVE